MKNDSEGPTDATESVSQHCLVCYTVLIPFETAIGIPPCGHTEICGLCHLRLRCLHKDDTCPICKVKNEHIVVDYFHPPSEQEKAFADYDIWGKDSDSDLYHVVEGSMFCPQEHFHDTIQPLLGVYCTVPDCVWALSSPPVHRTVPQLQYHLRQQHRLTLCMNCVDHQRDFVSRLPRYSATGLSKHRSSQHTICSFCPNQTFYDITALYVHCQAEHFKCHLCETHLQIPNEYYRNYKSLERHYESLHFPCRHPQCLEDRFVVFFNELDFRHHERLVHGIYHAGNIKLQLEVKLHRQVVTDEHRPASSASSNQDFMADGTAFVPPALPSTSSSADQLHPGHAARTSQLRQQAAALRPENFDITIGFPSLQQVANPGATSTSAVNSNRPAIGWTSEVSQRVASAARVGIRSVDADFPSLPTSTQPKKKPLVAARKPLGSAGGDAKAGGGWTTVSSNRIRTAPSPVAAAAAPPPILSAYRSTPAAPSQPVDLSDDRLFPALAPASTASRPVPYAAALAYASSSRNSTSTSMATVGRSQATKRNGGAATRAPDVASVDAFPSLSISDASKKKATPAPAARVPPRKGAEDLSISDLKGVLGSTGYKSLKQYSRDFAQRDMDAEAYVDHVAALFPRGYGDPYFALYVPALIRSSPPTADQAGALRYMNQLQFLCHGSS